MHRKLWMTAIAVAAAAGAGFGLAREAAGPVWAQGSVNRCECSAPTPLEKGGFIYHCACGNLYCAVIGPGQHQSTVACK